MYRKENNSYVFDGDLEQFLLDKGVEAEHIQRMKEKKLQCSKYIYYDSEYIKSGKEERENRLVPLSRVVGTSRGTVGKSVFENVRIIEDGERDYTRFKSCFSFLNKMTLTELKESYKKVSPVEMEYYIDEDEYYLTSDGNHRTLTAMLLGAEYINANVVPMYCNYEKKEKYLAEERFYEEFNIIQINYIQWGDFDITFEENNERFVVSGYTATINEDCYSIIERLSNDIKTDKKIAEKWLGYPKIIRNIAVRFHKNKRIIQYIKKSQPSNESRPRLLLCEC